MHLYFLVFAGCLNSLFILSRSVDLGDGGIST